MARPVGADADATKRRIRDAATHLFARAGHAGASLRAIASEAGVSLAMVHHYYGSKDSLYEACIDALYDEIAELQPRAAASLVGARDAQTMLDRMVTQAFRFCRERQTFIRLLMRDVMARGAIDDTNRDRITLPWLEVTTAAITGSNVGARTQTRLALQSVSALIVRYAVMTDEEMLLISGDETLVESLASIEKHLSNTATAMVFDVARR